MENHAYTLRTIIKSAGLPPMQEVAKQPGLANAVRVTVYYHDLRAAHSVATLRDLRGQGIGLTVIFLGRLAHKPLTYVVSPSHYNKFVAALQAVRFDTIKDQPNIPLGGQDLWLVERAAGGFYKSLILAPDVAQAPHSEIVSAVRTFVPGMVRVMME
jgi:hypothetical protein